MSDFKRFIHGCGIVLKHPWLLLSSFIATCILTASVYVIWFRISPLRVLHIHVPFMWIFIAYASIIFLTSTIFYLFHIAFIYQCNNILGYKKIPIKNIPSLLWKKRLSILQITLIPTLIITALYVVDYLWIATLDRASGLANFFNTFIIAVLFTDWVFSALVLAFATKQIPNQLFRMWRGRSEWSTGYKSYNESLGFYIVGVLFALAIAYSAFGVFYAITTQSSYNQSGFFLMLQTIWHTYKQSIFYAWILLITPLTGALWLALTSLYLEQQSKRAKN